MAKRKAGHSFCSFCGRSHDHFKFMVSGLAASICNECIDLCYKIMNDDRQRQAAGASTAEKSTNKGKKRGKKTAAKKESPAAGERHIRQPRRTRYSTPDP
jgi:ATP-dependent protease Clp ATPase subunit